jgi:hypothetical protein
MPGSKFLLRLSETPLVWIATRRISRARPMLVPSFLYLKSIVKPEEVPKIKVTMSGLSETHLKLGRNAYNKEVYKTEGDNQASHACTTSLTVPFRGVSS